MEGLPISFFHFRGLLLLIPLMFSVIPILVAVWFALKIHSMDTTLKEISHKLDTFIAS